MGYLKALALIPLLTALGLAGCGPIAGSTQKQTIELGMRFKAGTTIRYELTGSLQDNDTSPPGGQGSSSTSVTTKGDMSMLEALRVDAVAPDGTATVTLTVEKVTISMGGSTMGSALPKESLQMRIYRDGRVVVLGPNGQTCGLPEDVPTLFFSPLPSPDTVLFPNHPVKPGDTWDTTINSLPGLPPAERVVVVSRFLRYDKLDGRRVAVIGTSTNFPEDFAANTDSASMLPSSCAFLMAPGEGASPKALPTPPPGMTPPPGYKAPTVKVSSSGSLHETQTIWFDVEDGSIEKEVGSTSGDITTKISIQGAPVSGLPVFPGSITNRSQMVSTEQLTKTS